MLKPFPPGNVYFSPDDIAALTQQLRAQGVLEQAETIVGHAGSGVFTDCFLLDDGVTVLKLHKNIKNWQSNFDRTQNALRIAEKIEMEGVQTPRLISASAFPGVVHFSGSQYGTEYTACLRESRVQGFCYGKDAPLGDEQLRALAATIAMFHGSTTEVTAPSKAVRFPMLAKAGVLLNHAWFSMQCLCRGQAGLLLAMIHDRYVDGRNIQPARLVGAERSPFMLGAKRDEIFFAGAVININAIIVSLQHAA
ncbi:MAG: hypothetical protein GC131_00005 [Alphaproteobacteria bacterium]|nr:hypothetical protein [Alphaproteobacteria bacterium]